MKELIYIVEDDEGMQEVYEGAFELSRYNGQGKLYYPSGQLKYQGNFYDNVFSGTGQ